jgi:hypothetical protein
VGVEKLTFRPAKIGGIEVEKERMRQKVNAWILSSGEFDGVVDLDAVVRDPSHPTQLLPNTTVETICITNNAGCRAEGDMIPLALFASH